MASPFLKWAGGKSRLAPRIADLVPISAKRYVEPFLGAGAVFFAIAGQRLRTPALLSDSNEALIECFTVVRDDVGPLIDQLHRMALEFECLSLNERKTYYYSVREHVPATPIGRAARFIFLNRTAYNGLYRVNQKGGFNVPYGRYAKPRILFAEILIGAARALCDSELSHEDFGAVCARAERGDFVYLDPPYHPLSATSSFTAYTADSFGLSDQQRLAKAFDDLSARGAAAVLSNSAHPLIEDLYQGKGYNIRRVGMSRSINSRGSNRGPIDEFLIDNLARPEVLHWTNGSPK